VCESRVFAPHRFWHRIWTPSVAAAGLPPNLRIHDLRHTCAALLIARGAHPKAIQTHLGHSTIQVTMDRYGHLFPDEMDRLAEGLDAAYREATDTKKRAALRSSVVNLHDQLPRVQMGRLPDPGDLAPGDGETRASTFSDNG
jgi:hypothetical protein